MISSVLECCAVLYDSLHGHAIDATQAQPESQEEQGAEEKHEEQEKQRKEEKQWQQGRQGKLRGTKMGQL